MFLLQSELNTFGTSALLPDVRRVDHIVSIIFLASPNMVFVWGMTWLALLRFSFGCVIQTQTTFKKLSNTTVLRSP